MAWQYGSARSNSWSIKAPTKNMQLRTVIRVNVGNPICVARCLYSMLSTRPTIVTARDQGCHSGSNHIPVLPLPMMISFF